MNASSSAATQSLTIPDAGGLLVAIPGDGARFDPLEADPLTGSWTFAPLGDAEVLLGAQSDLLLLFPNASAAIPNLPGDYDRSGHVDANDFAIWKQQFGQHGAAIADGNSDGVVNLADYTIWRDHLGTGSFLAVQRTWRLPEPTSLLLSATVAFHVAFAWRQKSQ